MSASCSDLVAVILAGGRGSRMEPWQAPKCLLPIAGVPILHRVIQHLSGQHVEEIVVAVGYRSADVIRALRGLLGAEQTSDAGEDVSMCARIFHAIRERAIDGPILVCYGDELADVDVSQLLSQHERLGTSATITVHGERQPFGEVEMMPGGRLCKLEEKPLRWINIGFAVLEPAAYAQMTAEEDFADFIGRLDSDVGTYIHQGRRATVNTPADIARAEEVWK